MKFYIYFDMKTNNNPTKLNTKKGNPMFALYMQRKNENVHHFSESFVCEDDTEIQKN